MVQEVDFTQNAERLFNRSFYEIRKARTRFVVVYGGSGSGKSVSVHQSELINQFDADHNTLVIRKYGSDLYDSCYSLFEKLAGDFSVRDYFHFQYSNTKRQIVNKITGTKIILRGLDDAEKVKSIVGIKRIVIEEANQLDFKDFRELNRRARGIEGIQIIFILNPVDENHWIKKNFVDEDGPYHDRTTVLKYNYPDNKFLTEDDVRELELLKIVDINEYNIYVLGKWGIRDNKRAWLYNFDKNRHVLPTLPFLKSFPVYLSFDFNNEPFACVAFQMSPQQGNSSSFLHFIKEFSGHWKVEEMCMRIRTTFPGSILYVTGDRNGDNDDLGRNETLYDMIQARLNLSDKQMNLNTKNLEHNDSRILCNSMFGAYPNVKLSAAGCPNLISQCQAAKVDDTAKNGRAKPPGTLLKDRGDNKNDEFDGMRYAFQTYFLKFARSNFFRAVKTVSKQTQKAAA